MISAKSYLDIVEYYNEYFFERMLKGKQPSADFYATVAAAEKVNWVRVVAPDDAGSHNLLAKVRALLAASDVELRCEPSTLSLPGGPESVIVGPRVIESRRSPRKHSRDARPGSRT